MSIKIKSALRAVASAALASALAGTVACAAPGDTQPTDAGSFIAVASDMAGFHSWLSFDAGSNIVDQVHSDGTRTVYIACAKGYGCNLPRHGQTQFDLGTIIIKEVPVADGGLPQIFAMTKRGGGYNDGGATNWEWFDIQDAGPGDGVQIVWRGDGPPQGNTYGASHESCNECHALSQTNDFVASPPLQLTNF